MTGAYGPALPFPPNPDYGKGRAWRVIRLSRDGKHQVDGHLIDNYHEMRCRIRHDDGIVTAIEGAMIRFPTTACPGAPSALHELVGLRLDSDLAGLYERARVLRNCTHLFDIAILSMKHALRGDMVRTYEAIVPDQADGPVRIQVSCNGTPVHAWLAKDGRIVEPEHLAGRPLLKGFTRWTSATFDGDDLEAAALLGKTCFIATVRAFAPEGSAGLPIRSNTALAGTCYAYAPDRMADALFSDQIGERRPGIKPRDAMACPPG